MTDWLTGKDTARESGEPGEQVRLAGEEAPGLLPHKLQRRVTRGEAGSSLPGPAGEGRQSARAKGQETRSRDIEDETQGADLSCDVNTSASATNSSEGLGRWLSCQSACLTRVQTQLHYVD